MKVVITGATGNVGTSVLRALVHEPHVESIVGIARRRPEMVWPKTSWVEADVSRDELRDAGAVEVFQSIGTLLERLDDTPLG